MLKTLAVLSLAFASAAQANDVEPLSSIPATVQSMRTAALSGDRQAMKNLGYAYASGSAGMKGQRLPLAGCAWLVAIPWVNPQGFQDADVNNIATYCNALSPDQLQLAYRHAAVITADIAKTKR